MEWDLEKTNFTGNISIFSHRRRRRKGGRDYISDFSKKREKENRRRMSG